MDSATKWMVRAACGVVLLGGAGVVALIEGSVESSKRAEAVNLCKLRVNYKGYHRIGRFREARQNMNECLSEYGLRWSAEAPQKTEAEKLKRRIALQCQSIARKSRRDSQQRKADEEFRNYSQPIWEGSKLYQSEPRTIALETEAECKTRVSEGQA